MSFDPTPIITALVSGAATAGAGALIPKPKMPDLSMPKVITSAVEPPKAPITASSTSALQRARLNQKGTGNSDIILTSLFTREKEQPVSRTTLLGQ